MSADIKMIIANNKYLSGVNGNWRSYFQDLADFCLPRKAWIDTIKTTGERIKYNFLYDSVAIRGLQTMAAGFHSNLTNPATKFFEIRLRSPKKMNSYANRRWCHDTTDVLQSLITPGSTNFDTSAQEYYVDWGCFGTGCILIQKDHEAKARFTPVPIEQLNLEEDSNGRVCAIYRNFKLQPIQAFMLWGNNAGKNVLEMIKEDKFFCEPGLDFLHYVGPRERRDFTKQDNLNMPYASVWINCKEATMIYESGFKRFPYKVGRFWKHALDVFGFSPAMNALADIKLMNAGKRTLMRRAMKETDPPIGVPSKGWSAPLNMNPVATNYYDAKLGPESLRFLSPTGTFSIAQDFFMGIKEAIEENFYVPLFKTLSDVNKNMTIPEVQQRINEARGLLGPAVSRSTDEVWSPLIFDLLDIAQEANLLPKPPDDIFGEDMDVIYLGNLARAMRMSEVQPISNFLTTIGNMAQVKPEVLDKVDEDKTVDIIANLMSIPPEILRDDKMVKEIRAARQKQQMEQIQLNKMEQASKAAKQGADAHKSMQGANQ
jgi:Bacteriophage head to tail connecting protein